MICYFTEFCGSGMQAGFNCSTWHHLGLLTLLYSVNNKAHLNSTRRLHLDVCASVSLSAFSTWLAQASSPQGGVRYLDFLHEQWLPRTETRAAVPLQARLQTGTTSLSPVWVVWFCYPSCALCFYSIWGHWHFILLLLSSLFLPFWYIHWFGR